MKNLLFFLWLMFYPLLYSIWVFISVKSGMLYKDYDKNGINSGVYFLLYLIVAYLLYNK